MAHRAGGTGGLSLGGVGTQVIKVVLLIQGVVGTSGMEAQQ